MKLRIGIVEDEVLTSKSIAIHLKKMGHEVMGVYSRFESVFQGASDAPPDLYLIDIRLKGRKSGLDVAQELQSRQWAPFLFLTSNTDSKMVLEAMKTKPLGYITKPFTYEDLFIGIELAKSKFNFEGQSGRKIEIKVGTQLELLPANEVVFLEAARSYVTIYLESETKVLRQSLGNFLQSFEPGEMVRVHRSYAVNPRKVESASTSRIIAQGHKIPLGPGYRELFEKELVKLGGR